MAWSLVSQAGSPTSRARTLSNDSTDSGSKYSSYSNEDLVNGSTGKLEKDLGAYAEAVPNEKDAPRSNTLVAAIGSQILRTQFIMF